MFTANFNSFLKTVCLIEVETLPFNNTQKLIALFHQGLVKLLIFAVSTLIHFQPQNDTSLMLNLRSYRLIFNLILQGFNPQPSQKFNVQNRFNFQNMYRIHSKFDAKLCLWASNKYPNISQIEECVCKLQQFLYSVRKEEE